MRTKSALLAVLIASMTVAPRGYAVDLVEEARFVVPRQVQVTGSLAAGERVYAMVAVEEPAANEPAPRRKGLLAAWDLKGNLQWQTELPITHKMIMARGQLVLAHDDGTLQAQRELIGVDAITGKVLRRVPLDGRPLELAYYPAADRIVILQMPQKRLETLKDAWMEVAAYDRDFKQSWLSKFDGTELEPLRLNGQTIVVGTNHPRVPVLARLDPATGKMLWSGWWGEPLFGQAPAAVTDKQPFTPDRLLAAPLPKAIGFLDMERCMIQSETGVWTMPVRMDWSKDWPVPNRLYHHGNRLYFTVWQLKGITHGAVELPTGKLLWTDETNTVSYKGPVFWGERVVFLSRRLTNGLTGGPNVTDLRVYDAAGKLRVQQSKKAPEWWDDTIAAQAVGDRLYVVRNHELIALKWQEKK